MWMNYANSIHIFTVKDAGTKSYFVKRCGLRNGTPEFSDGLLWNSAIQLSDFVYPWEKMTPPEMFFRAVHDEDWLYCNFRVRDRNVLTYVNNSSKEEVLYGDRVEIFFAADELLTNYYGLEIDANGRVYDYHASHYRKFNAAWQWPPDQLRIKSKRSEDGYEVAICIGIRSLIDLGVISGNTLRAGIFRGKCMEINFTEDRMRWISWIRPDSAFPDFHIPSAFGTLTLE